MKKSTAKTTPEKEAEFYRRFRPEAFTAWDNMKFLADKNGIDLCELAAVAGISPKTLNRRAKRPDTFQLAEVIDMCRLFGVTLAQISTEPVYPSPKPIKFDE